MTTSEYLVREEGVHVVQHLDLDDAKVATAWARFVRGFTEQIRVAHGDSVKVLEGTHLNGVEDRVRNCEYPVISMDGYINGARELAVSRHYQPGGRVRIETGRRPGYRPIHEQIADIPPGEYALLDDQVVTGATMEKMVEQLATKGIIIKLILAGATKANLGMNIPVEAPEVYSTDLIGIIDPRNFLIGTFGGGLVIRLHDGELVRLPYLYPLADPAARCFFPHEKALEFSRKLWEMNRQFWEEFPHITLCDGEPYFNRQLSRYGIPDNTPLFQVAERMIELIDFRHVDMAAVNRLADDMVASGRKGLVLFDLNDTLISQATHAITAPQSDLQQAVSQAREGGWDVGLCSNSPHDKLEAWLERHGIAGGPIVSENGSVFNNQLISTRPFDLDGVRTFVQQWCEDNGIPLLSEEVWAPESGKPQPQEAGVAFGAGRKASVSVFCFRGAGKKDGDLTQRLGQAARERYGMAVDVSPKDGFIGFHNSIDFRQDKGETLRAIGCALLSRDIATAIIGNAMSDVTMAPTLVHSWIVGNGDEDARLAADFVVNQPHTRGCIQALQKITAK